MAIRRRCLAPLPFMTGFLGCCWFYVSTDSVCFSGFAISHALRYRVLAICCQPRRSSASGSRNHRAALYCRQAAFLCNRSTEIRFGGSASRLLMQAQLQRCSTFISFRYSRGRLASSAEIPYCVLSSDQAGRLAAAGFCVSTILRLAGARRALRGAPPQRVPGAQQQIINLRQLAVDCKSASTCKVALCVPQQSFPVPD